VHIQDRSATIDVRLGKNDLPVESAWTEERRIENVGAIGGGYNDDVRICIEAVHLDEDLVQGLLALIVATAKARATLSPDRIDLVDKHDTRGVALGLVEKVSHARGADTHEHLDELRP
jgi:hypothetical protein